MAAGVDRQQVLEAIQTRLDALRTECPATTTPLAGQHGEVLWLQAAFLHVVDAAAAQQLIARVRATHPELADQLATARL